MARFGPSGGQYRPLAGTEIRRIHEASMRVLDTTGLCVRLDEARELYRRAGARVEGDRVLITETMVESALAQVPGRVLLAGRDPAQDVVLEETRVYAGTGGSPAQVLDPGADTVRPASLKDLTDLVRLADALPHCDFVVMPLIPTDVPEQAVPINRFYTCLSNTTKHVMGGCGTVEGARQAIEMASLIAGGPEALRERPIVSCITSWMVSPLHLDPGVTQILIEWCRHGLPVVLSAAPMAGSTSPVSLAGTLVQLNAEQLSGIVLTQLIRPGTPVLAGYIPGVANLRTGDYLGGAIEFGIMQAAAAQLAHHYRVPIYGSGGMSDSKLPDAQAGYEKMGTLLLAAMGGCNYIHHAIGMVTNMSATSLEQAVIDDEIVGMAWRVLQGVEVTDESLAEAAIGRVGPGGHFLMDRHTLRAMRSELSQPALADRQNRAAWEAAGRQDTRARAGTRVAELLASHRRAGLPAAVDAAIRARFDIREALQMLAQEGLVTIKSHSGYLVTQLSLKQLRDLFELREVLEIATAERAARRITDEQIEELCRVYTGYTGDDDDSYDRYTAENRRFHCLIAQAAGNQEVTELLAHLHDRLARFMVLRQAGETMQYTHARIVDALRQRDPGAARQAMRDELLDTRRVVLDRLIEEQGDAWHLGQA